MKARNVNSTLLYCYRRWGGGARQTDAKLRGVEDGGSTKEAKSEAPPQ